MSKADEVEKHIQQRKSKIIKVKGTKKVEKTKIHFGRSNEKATSIKEVINNMTLDIIKWRKIIHVANSNKLILRFHITSQNFGTKNCGLKNVVKTRVYNIHKAKDVFGSMFLITYFSM